LLAATAVAQPNGAARGTPAAGAVATSVAAPSERGSALVKALAFASAEAASALAGDDFSAYKKQLPAVRSALASYLAGVERASRGTLQQFQDGLGEPADINVARRAFEPFSSAVVDLARGQGGMAPVTGKARWLQRASGAKNPFFGAKMLRCGTELAGPGKMAAAPLDAGGPLVLPPGHPPIDAVSVAAYLRAQGTTKAAPKSAPGGSCGSCGMSQAAMAAGEPCEHSKK
jgi:Cu(I)/Ag(I) efflux system membrane fusion protein